MTLVGFANLAIPALITLLGLYLAHSYRRQINLQNDLRVAEKRLSAYAALWDRMTIASPVRATEWDVGSHRLKPLTPKQRERLFYDLIAWYYENGNGMVLSKDTRTLYLQAKDNLVCPLTGKDYKPKLVREELKKTKPDKYERERGIRSIRQLSLLRTQMRFDLQKFAGKSYQIGKISPKEEKFLEECEIKLDSDPWKDLDVK